MTDRRGPFVRLCLYAAGALLVPALFFLVSLRNLHDYGETSDEAYDRMVGQFYFHDYPKTGFAMINERLDPLQQQYGAFFDTIDVRIANLLWREKGWVKEEIPAHHVPIAFVSSLLLCTIFLLGAAAGGSAAGFASQFALLLMPQFVGHSQNNMKDQPMAFFFTLAMLGFFLAIRGASRIREGGLRSELGLLAGFAVSGALGGVAYASKINGVFVLPVAFVFALPFIVREPRRLPLWVLRFAVSTAAYVATVPLLWPLYRTNTLARFGETLRAFREHWYNELVFYLGEHMAARDVPWHFPFVMLGINTPLLQLAFALLGLGILIRLLWKKQLDEAAPLLLFSIWLFLPIAVQLMSKVPRYDGVRHYLYLLPALALLAGVAVTRAWRWAAERRLGPVWLRAAVLAIPVVLLARTLVVFHPYQVVFFNALVGGTAGAAKIIELDYAGTSLLEASRYMNEHLPKGSRVGFTQAGVHRFRVEGDRISFVEPANRPNYKVSLRRGMVKTYDTDDDYLNPRRPVVFRVAVKGAPLLEILEMPENRDIPNGTSIEPVATLLGAEAPGLRARVTTDDQPFRDLPPLANLTIACPGGVYLDHRTELQARGYLRISTPGEYTFELASDDGSTLWLGKDALLSSVSPQGERKVVHLEAGLYPVKLKYRNEIGDACLAFRFQPPGGTELVDVTAPALLHDPTTQEAWNP